MGYKICMFLLAVLSMETVFATKTDDFSCIKNDEDLCKNDGFCVDFERGEMKCYCPAHWGGQFCELLNTHCYNGVFIKDEVRCDCHPGYGGEYCETKCDCKNGGSGCDIDGKCTCVDGFTGDMCEKKVCEFPQIYNSTTDSCSSCAEGETCVDESEYLIVGMKSATVYTAISCACFLVLVIVSLTVYTCIKKKKPHKYTLKPESCNTPAESVKVAPISYNKNTESVGLVNEAFNDSDDSSTDKRLI